MAKNPRGKTEPSTKAAGRKTSSLKISGLKAAGIQAPTLNAPNLKVPTVRARVASLLAEKMPGFKIAADMPPLAPSVEDSNMRSEHGPSYAQLRRKFGAGDNAAAAPQAFSDAEPSRVTERVVSRDGRFSRVVDVDPLKRSVKTVSG